MGFISGDSGCVEDDADGRSSAIEEPKIFFNIQQHLSMEIINGYLGLQSRLCIDMEDEEEGRFLCYTH